MRAEVWQEWPWDRRSWCAAIYEQPHYVRHAKRIRNRNSDYLKDQQAFPNHAEALKWALEQVGLGPHPAATRPTNHTQGDTP